MTESDKYIHSWKDYLKEPIWGMKEYLQQKGIFIRYTNSTACKPKYQIFASSW